jgi:hypothetical protein
LNDPRSAPVLCNNGLRFFDDSFGVTLEKSSDRRSDSSVPPGKTSFKPFLRAVILFASQQIRLDLIEVALASMEQSILPLPEIKAGPPKITSLACRAGPRGKSLSSCYSGLSFALLGGGDRGFIGFGKLCIRCHFFA